MNQVYKGIIERALDSAVMEAARNIIEGRTGSGIDSDIKSALREKALEVVRTPEIEQMIKDRLVYWISKA